MEFRYEGNSLKSGVYYITNTISGRVYIGSAKCFKKRGYQHLRALEKGKHFNNHLQASFKEYGTDAFIFTVEELVEGDKAARTAAEQRHLDLFLDKWDRVYNHMKDTIRKDGPWSNTPEESRRKRSLAQTGKTRTEETRRKMSLALVGRPHTEEMKRNLSAALRVNNHQHGRKRSTEHKRKISEANKGRTVSEETRLKISNAKMGHTVSEETKKKISDANKGCIPWNKGMST